MILEVRGNIDNIVPEECPGINIVFGFRSGLFIFEQFHVINAVMLFCLFSISMCSLNTAVVNVLILRILDYKVCAAAAFLSPSRSTNVTNMRFTQPVSSAMEPSSNPFSTNGHCVHRHVLGSYFRIFSFVP